MNTEKLKEKLKKAEQSLQPLIEKRKEIDKKIKVKKAEINLINNQILESEFQDFSSQLKENGVSLSELKKAIEAQDFSLLKEIK